MLLQSLIKNTNSKQLQYAKFLDGRSPLFSQFGQNIYASDIVQICIGIIADECSKLQPRHIIRDEEGLIQPLKKGDNFNRLFKFKPNPLMTTKDFIEKTIWQLYLNYNCFIYPTYDIMVDANGNAIFDLNGNPKKYFTAFYPLNPVEVDYLQDETGTLFIKMWFANGQNYTLPYLDVIHLRKKFSVNDVMGGGMNGQPDNQALLKVLQINDTVLQGVGKAIKTSLTVRGVYKMTSVMDPDKVKAEREHFEQNIDDSKSGVLALDYKGDYTPLTVDPKIIDKDTMQFLKDTVLDWFDVSMPILTGDYTDDQYQAFYNKAIEPVVIGLGQAFSGCIFSQREQDVGHEIVFYYYNLELMSVKNKLAIADILGNRGARTNNELLALFGLPPYPDGNKRYVNLNYINADIADQYQLLRAGLGKASNDNTNENGGNNNGEG